MAGRGKEGEARVQLEIRRKCLTFRSGWVGVVGGQATETLLSQVGDVSSL